MFTHELLLHNHLEKFHKIDSLKNPDRLLPDINHQDFYCYSCKRISNNKSAYHDHLRRVYRMDIPDDRLHIKYPHITPNKYDPIVAHVKELTKIYL